MEIRNAVTEDLPEILSIYARARAFMRENGNLTQWQGGFPPRSLLESDIAQCKLYVCVSGGTIACVFYYAVEQDPTYGKIVGPGWLSDAPYGVIHRIAAAQTVRGAATFCIQWAIRRSGNLRMDTHRDNVPMRSLLKKLGFTPCGRIYLSDGSPRYAYQKRL